jgi:hypothetical protein
MTKKTDAETGKQGLSSATILFARNDNLWLYITENKMPCFSYGKNNILS